MSRLVNRQFISRRLHRLCAGKRAGNSCRRGMGDARSPAMKPLLIAFGLLAATATPPQHHAAQITLPLHLTGALISAGGVGNPTGTGRVELQIKRWSSADERSALLKALTDKG